MLGPLLFAQRWLHQEIQYIFLLITRRPTMALGLFSLLFFPGVLLHELSHYVMAFLMRVRTGRFSLLPSLMPDGKLRLGYVETAQTDFFREALIGAAPLITGGVTVAYLGITRLGLGTVETALGRADWTAFLLALRSVPDQPDFWMWFYLAFAVSSTMLPSASDRRAWLPIGLVAVGLVLLALLAGEGQWMLDNAAPWLDRALRALATVFGVSLALHLVLLIPLRLLHGLLTAVTGMHIVSSQN